MLEVFSKRKGMTNNIRSAVFLSVISVLLLAGCGKRDAQQPAAGGQAGPAALAPEGEKNQLPGGGWFTWRFAEKPKLGTAIVKVQAFDKDGKPSQAYDVIGEFGMPSMRAHDSGPVKFQLNKKGDYLLPVNIVMAGEWELKIRVMKGTEQLYEGPVLFTV